MTITFNRTRTQLAQRVLGKVTKIGAASAATADYDVVYEAIDLRLKSLHKNGTFWRKVGAVPATFSLTASINSASATADILFPIQMTVRDGDRDEPVKIVGTVEFDSIRDKTETGLPQKAIWRGGVEFAFWPIPASDTTARLIYEKVADDSSAGGVVDMDVGMLRAMIDLLKYDVGDDFGIEETTMMRWEREARRAEIEINSLSVQRVNLSTVAVDDWCGERETDYR